MRELVAQKQQIELHHSMKRGLSISTQTVNEVYNNMHI